MCSEEAGPANLRAHLTQRQISTFARVKYGKVQHETQQTPASGDTNSRKGSKLLEFKRLLRPLWIRRVLVRAQEGQLEGPTPLWWVGPFRFCARCYRFCPALVSGARYVIGLTQDCDQASLALQPCSRSFDSLPPYRGLTPHGAAPALPALPSRRAAAPDLVGAKPPSRSHSTRPPSACPRAVRRFGPARAWRGRTMA